MGIKFLLVAGILVAGFGCESVDSDLLGDGPTPQEIGDVERITREGVEADLYRADLSKELGEAGGRIVLVESIPVVEFTEKYTWTLQLEGEIAVNVNRVEARATMPDHGHGTIPEMIESEVEGGEFVLSPLNFYMGGIWKVEILLFSEDIQVGEQSFYFYVEG